MPTAPPAITPTLRALEEALERRAPLRFAAPTRAGTWRWEVRQRMIGVRDALLALEGTPTDGWLAARGGAAMRERTVLLTRLSALGEQVLVDSDLDGVAVEVRRLVVDVQHHLQRVSDLAYDDVELELGGSE